jgi:hypothetical protein
MPFLFGSTLFTPAHVIMSGVRYKIIDIMRL